LPEKVHRRLSRARLTREFRWEESADEGAFYVQIVVGPDGWTVRVDADELMAPSAPGAFEVVLKAHDAWAWALGKRTVKLIGGSLKGPIFVGVWKAFEAELARLNVKADLVQLCEYYTYRPRFNGRMSLVGQCDQRWNVLQRVVEGIGTREILTGGQIADFWGCSEDEVLGHMLWLRTLAYEARNSNTNPQIPQGSYLIPYTFPTLNPMSVQVRKSLVADDE
jgi:DNA (cytosine-5)-methyltransferase 1